MLPPPSVLGNLTLGYQLVWNREREPAAVLLFLRATDDAKVSGEHLLKVLAQAWFDYSPQMMVVVQSAALLADVLTHARPAGPWIAVQESLLADPAVAAQLRVAHGRGVPLMWRGETSQKPREEFADCFRLTLLPFTAGNALLALRATLQPAQQSGGVATTGLERGASSNNTSPVQPGQIYENVPSRVLADHCLDDREVWGVAGWPVDDMLHAYSGKTIEPGEQVIDRLLEATEADLPLDRIEDVLTEDPLLVYRFLRHANSAALGARTGIDSLRHGLMVLGMTTFERWLREQLQHVSNDIDLRPVRTTMALRARLMALLLDAGEEDDLRSEVHLCGLLSQIDRMLAEPLGNALRRFPISERILDAILANHGPYAPFLQMATALESFTRTGEVAALCDEHGMDASDVNRAVLRALSQARPQPLNTHSRF